MACMLLCLLLEIFGWVTYAMMITHHNICMELKLKCIVSEAENKLFSHIKFSFSKFYSLYLDLTIYTTIFRFDNYSD